MLNLFELIGYEGANEKNDFSVFYEKIHIDFEKINLAGIYSVNNSYLGFTSPDYENYGAMILWINVQAFELFRKGFTSVDNMDSFEFRSAVKACTILKDEVEVC